MKTTKVPCHLMAFNLDIVGIGVLVHDVTLLFGKEVTFFIVKSHKSHWWESESVFYILVNVTFYSKNYLEQTAKTYIGANILPLHPFHFIFSDALRVKDIKLSSLKASINAICTDVVWLKRLKGNLIKDTEI